jgi:hypothetical protein
MKTTHINQKEYAADNQNKEATAPIIMEPITIGGMTNPVT